MGFRRDNTFFTSPAYTSTLDPICQMQHPDKFLGCEDMNLVDLDGRTFIFTACLSDFANRKRVQSEQREEDTIARAKSGAKITGDKIFRWDLDSDEVVELELKGFPGANDGGDRAWHGMDINQLPDGSLSLYIINHRLNGSVVEKFSHDPKTDFLAHVVTIPTAGHVANANNIYALPNLDHLNAFYITDDHYYTGELMRTIEDYTRRPWSKVNYYSTAGWKLAFPKVASANGITGDKKSPGRVYISACTDGEIIVTHEDPQNQGVLKEIQRIPLNFVTDNPSLTASGADLFIAGYTAAQDLAKHFSRENIPTGSVVARINTKQLGSAFFGEEGGYTSTPIIEELLVDIQGRWINASTTAVFRERTVVEDTKVAVDEEDDEEDLENGEAGKGLGDLYVTGLSGRGEHIRAP